MKTFSVLGDLWETDQPDLLEFAAKNPPPRPGSRLLQLRRDLRSPLMWILVAIACAGITTSVLAQQPLLAVPATLSLAIVAFMFLSVARGHARSALMRGVIPSVDALRAHPLHLGQVAKASLVSQERFLEASVSLSSAGAVRLLRQNGHLDVLVLYDPKAEYSSVVGWRVPA